MARDEESAFRRTIDAKVTRDSLVKPGELVDVIEVTPMTLTDRRIYNLLLANAWDRIDQPVKHRISKEELRGARKSNERVGDSIERLMRSFVKLTVIWNGEPAIERVQLLGGNIEAERDDGLIEYEIPPRLREIIGNSVIFARLRKEIMFALTSKYALALYEMVQKRVNLSYVNHEVFDVDDLRNLLGVPKGKLATWHGFKSRAIEPAIQEVNDLADVQVEATPIKTGKKVTHVRISWRRKAPEAIDALGRKYEFASVGRRVRDVDKETVSISIDDRVRGAASPSSASNLMPARHDERSGMDSIPPLKESTIRTAALRYPGFDVKAGERAWREWAAGKEPPRNPDAAFLAFFGRFVREAS